MLLRLCTLPRALSLSDLKDRAVVFKERASALDEATGRLVERLEEGAKGLDNESGWLTAA